MTVPVTWPGGSSATPRHPSRCRMPKVHLQGQTPLSCCPHSPKAGAGTTLVAALTSWRSGSLLCGAGWGKLQRKHKLVSSDFSQPRQPPSASCRDGPAQLHSLQLEMEGSRWPCLAQIPARLPGRCGQSDGLVPRAGIHRS